MVDVVKDTINILKNCLQLGDQADSFDESTLLLGSIPELDSMAVVTLITSIEEQYGVFVDDDEITADTFESVGSLANFIENKISE